MQNTNNIGHPANKYVSVPYWMITLVTATFIFGSGTLLNINMQMSEIRSDIRLLNYKLESYDKNMQKIDQHEKRIDRIENQIEHYYKEDINYIYNKEEVV